MQYSQNKDHQHHKWLSGCAGQAADAVSAYTQDELEDAPKLLNIPKSECLQTYGYVYHDTKWPKSLSSVEDPVIPLERNLCGHPLAGLLWKGSLRKFYWSTVGKKFLNGNAYSCTERKDYSCLCTWMTSNWLERGEPTSFLDHVQFGLHSKTM